MKPDRDWLFPQSLFGLPGYSCSYATFHELARRRSAGFQTCRIADFPIGGALRNRARCIGGRSAGLETRDTADLEVCATARGFIFPLRDSKILESFQNFFP